MKIAFSPCPNDTFVFHAWVHGLVPGAPKLDVTYADIDITNHLATRPDGPDVLKISSAALPWVLSDYALLPCGGAMGRGCGPLILTKDASKETDLSGKRVAVPSERSTAYLLFRLWTARHVSGDLDIQVVPFDKIMPAVREGTFDAGLVIHEARFTYPSYGLHLLADLGEWWEEDTGLPIPLGSIIARRTLDVKSIAEWTRASVEYAWNHPEASREYVMQHAQEMDPEVAKKHIDLYVNDFTADLGEEGYSAIYALLSRAAKEGIVPEIKPEMLR
ncbi:MULTISPECIES: 1,4-dihydroxy-6-naphthoate synthase [Thermoactinomyces]|jgi:1,4-dihydroxy-6-naphthoate synthase|uniref:1,4-dihydroxy-6-naphtoate synthase n=1 Tax=Thermoactinomyces intermedius TaxID=2024 RepID=A0A8I1DC63_THEIN|nr:MULTISPECIES: 1,4-dihydroxy-6-naphthoate synthase [Thermoactinomyces]KFZ41581.1 1,4-dihydroxy-6-naphthoate synthase [Thermoactinomyces sp. Gus2-1]KYQ86345.1 1,4-dihydroxy-6-naphthoate synthase [Thermoactinomyces sp. AS95]MBA4548309.1 1,4-dihydroxy-6-naphthoate synthase [Thermoactinomyces intermedius]MBA4837462.1 1,4-dihydroxy-6-naphthoate synthase [Thermoactinomyces intermedius]MBH8586390.1 1,4-dihydroxy-6-naphthoate synthase [Thermoactinomyces sp. CICC 10520]